MNNKDRLRVMHVITRLIVGGAQENTLLTAHMLKERFGDEVTLITGPAKGPEGDLFDWARQKSIDVRLVVELCRPIHLGKDWRAYRRLCALIEKYRPDVVHTHSSKAGILGRAAAARCKVPAIVHTIHGLAFGSYERWWRNHPFIAAERWAANRTHQIICVADAMIDRAVAAGIALREKFVTIYSGMEVEPFLHPPRNRKEVRLGLGLSENDVVIAKVSRLFERKGHEDVIEAAGKLKALCEKHNSTSAAPRVPRLRFLFVGGGQLRDQLEAKVRSAGLANLFVFTGLLPPEQIPEILGATDLVVHASYQEGLARVLSQALIAAKPVVSYDTDGAREVVLPERTGYLVPLGDRAGLAEALWRLVRDPDHRDALGRTGRELFTDRFRHDHMTERIRDVYQQILHRP